MASSIVKDLVAIYRPSPNKLQSSAFSADRRIRRYIRSKQKLIALLEEQKQAIIHQAVTGQIDVRTGQPLPGLQALRRRVAGGRAGALGGS